SRCRRRRPVVKTESAYGRCGSRQGIARRPSRTRARNSDPRYQIFGVPLILRKFAALPVLCVSMLFARHACSAVPADWTTPFPAFRIAGNLYYVGSADLAAYL